MAISCLNLADRGKYDTDDHPDSLYTRQFRSASSRQQGAGIMVPRPFVPRIQGIIDIEIVSSIGFRHDT
jgi:hypothetical protein